MRLIFIIIFVPLISCTSIKKEVYWCGDHECVDKKEINEYFDENITIEIKTVKKSKSINYDLIALNNPVVEPLDQDKSKKGKFFGLVKDRDTTNLSDTNSEKNKLKKQKNDVIEQRKIAKIKLKNEKKEVIKKKVKDIFSINKSDKKTNIKKKEIVSKKNNVDIVSKKISCKELTDCTFDEISNSIKEKADNKDYPDITSK